MKCEFTLISPFLRKAIMQYFSGLQKQTNMTGIFNRFAEYDRIGVDGQDGERRRGPAGLHRREDINFQKPA
jgi:hypothetical protein